MRVRLSLALVLSLLWLVGCGGGSSVDRATPQEPATNPGGDPITAVMTANFDPAAGVLPFPNNLLLLGTTDLTLNPPVADPSDFSDPAAALATLDGFSTVAPWSFTFSRRINPSTVVPGSSVRLFEVQFQQGTIAVTGINRELVPGQDFFATVAPTDASGQTVAVIPLRPLNEMTGYMAVVTNGITDTDGNPATPSQTYFLTKRTQPLVTSAGISTEPLLDNASAGALEPLRQLVNAQEAAAASAGIARDDIVLSFTATTQSVSPVLNVIRSQAAPTSIQMGQACIPQAGCLTTSDVIPGTPGIADLYIGVMETPYFGGIPSAANPTAPLTQFWRAAPGAYVPPFDQFGLNPNSTNITVANPIPVETGRPNIPVLMTVPNAGSGQTRPASGWPVVIFQHGITGNRSQMLALADTMASIGFATIAIDLPLHGITDPTSPLYVENTPFGPIAGERTFDLDLQNNATGAPGPDGNIDPSGTWFINLQSLLTSRDNLRQAQADLSTLALNIPSIDLTGDGLSDVDASNINFVGLSLGAMSGVPFLAVEPTVSNGVLSVPGGGIANLLAGSETFGPQIRAGLQAAGVEPFSADYFQFLLIAQTVLDSADPINWGARTVLDNSVLLQQVAGDAVVPNAVEGAPLAGTEPLIAVMGLDAITGTTQDPMGIRGAVRLLQGDHGSLLSPAASPAVTAEMQGQAASMVASGGAAVQIGNPDLIQND
ncbi:MAG: Ig-like domain-containing protein [Wenzhouxiangella sp.]